MAVSNLHTYIHTPLRGVIHFEGFRGNTGNTPPLIQPFFAVFVVRGISFW